LTGETPVLESGNPLKCHCEEQRDEAISSNYEIATLPAVARNDKNE